MHNKERVIDLKALCRCLLEKWRFLLLAALLAGAVFAAIEGYRQYGLYKRSREAQAREQTEETTQESGTSKAQELKVLSNALDIKNAHLVDSIVARIDPYSEGRATADFIVRIERESVEETAAPAAAQAEETAEAVQEEAAAEASQNSGEQGDYDEIRDRALNIIGYYTSCVLYRIDYTEAANQLGERPDLIRELVSVSDGVKTDSLASIKVIYPTQEGAELIRDTILEQLRTLSPAAQAQYGPHELQIVNEASAVVMDSNLYKWAGTRAAEITALINSRKTLDKNLSSGTAAAPVTVIGKRDVVIAAAKQGGVGVLAGLAAALVLVMLYLLAAGKILSGREFNRHFGLRKIACVPGRKYGSLKGLDRLAAGIDSAYYNHPQRNVCLQVADANLGTVLRRDSQVALVSDLPQEYMEKLAAEMNKTGHGGGQGIRYFAIPCLEQTPESVEAVRNCDAAVIVAKAEKSTYKGAEDVLDTVSLLGRDVIGSIVLM